MNYRTKKVKTEKNLKMVNPNTDSNLLQESQGGFTTFQSGYQGHGEDELTNFLIDLADELDEEGKTSEANFIDFLIKKNATTETKFSSDPFDKFMDKVYSHSEDESFDTTIYLKEVLYNYKENLKKYNARIPALEEAISESKIKKEAAALEEDPFYVSDRILDVIKIMLYSIKFENRPNSYKKIREKLEEFDPLTMSGKKAPGGAAIGVSLALIKNILNSKPELFIRTVLNDIKKKVEM
jgi:hypothetical protein